MGMQIHNNAHYLDQKSSINVNTGSKLPENGNRAGRNPRAVDVALPLEQNSMVNGAFENRVAERKMRRRSSRAVLMQSMMQVSNTDNSSQIDILTRSSNGGGVSYYSSSGGGGGGYSHIGHHGHHGSEHIEDRQSLSVKEQLEKTWLKIQDDVVKMDENNIKHNNNIRKKKSENAVNYYKTYLNTAPTQTVTVMQPVTGNETSQTTSSEATTAKITTTLGATAETASIRQVTIQAIMVVLMKVGNTDNASNISKLKPVVNSNSNRDDMKFSGIETHHDRTPETIKQDPSMPAGMTKKYNSRVEKSEAEYQLTRKKYSIYDRLHQTDIADQQEASRSFETAKAYDLTVKNRQRPALKQDYINEKLNQMLAAVQKETSAPPKTTNKVEAYAKNQASERERWLMYHQPTYLYNQIHKIAATTQATTTQAAAAQITATQQTSVQTRSSTTTAANEITVQTITTQATTIPSTQPKPDENS